MAKKISKIRTKVKGIPTITEEGKTKTIKRRQFGVQTRRWYNARP